jgi:hypothetical protein
MSDERRQVPGFPSYYVTLGGVLFVETVFGGVSVHRRVPSRPSGKVLLVHGNHTKSAAVDDLVRQAFPECVSAQAGVVNKLELNAVDDEDLRLMLEMEAEEGDDDDDNDSEDS